MANPKLAMDNPLFKVMVFALVLAVLAYNVMSFSKERGADSRMVDALARLERLSDPTRTIYVYPDMEGMLTWQWADWGGHWNSVCDFGPAPLETPMFKWISMTTPIVLNPKWTPAEYVAYMKKQMDCAFDKGYRVIASPSWARFDKTIGGSMTLLHAKEHGLALVPLLRSYHAKPIVGGPNVN